MTVGGPTDDQLKALVALVFDKKPDPAIVPELVALRWADENPVKITVLGREVLRFVNPKNMTPENMH